MKVLQINSVCGIGSTGRIATDIHKILVEQGHDSYIAYGRGNARSCNNTIRIGNTYDNYAHVALTRIHDKHGYGSRQATKKFIKKVQIINPDIIHLHNIHGYYLNIELLFDYLISSKKPVIWTLHDCWAFTGHCAHFEYAGCYKWINECYNCQLTKNYPKSWFTDNSQIIFRNKKRLFTEVENLRIITPSIWLKRYAKKSYLGKYPIRVINNGINLDQFKPSQGRFRDEHKLKNKFVILGVSNVWSYKKGFEVFLELSKELKSDEIIVLVGLKEKQLIDLPSNIIGVSKTENPKELAIIYSASDIFVNPTLEDNFPTTNLESLACGTPVITYDTGGCSEVINHSNGFVVKAGDIRALKQQINHFKSSKNKLFGVNIINDVRKQYNCSDRFNDYIALYKELINEKSIIPN